MSTVSVVKLVEEVARAVGRQRAILEAGELDQLAEVTAELEAAYRSLESHEGGLEGVRRKIEALPDEERDPLREQVRRTWADLRVAGDLIRTATHRIAALQTFQSNYGPRGPSAGARLSRRA